MPFSAVWSCSPLLAFLSSLIKVYIICHSQQSDQGLYYMPFSAVWSRSTIFFIFSGLMRVYSNGHSQQSDQGLHNLPFSAVFKFYTVCPSQPSDQRLHCLPFSAAWSTSTLFTILSTLIRDCTVCHFQQSDQGQVLHCLSQEQYDQGLQHLPFQAVWSRSTLFAFHSSLIRVYTVCHSQQSGHVHHYLPFSEVWSRATRSTVC